MPKEGDIKKMKKVVSKRIMKYAVEMLLTLLLVTILSFLLMRLSPVDPATAYAKRNTVNPTQEQIQTIRIEMRLDKPLLIQYGLWLKNAVQLDFGKSLVNGGQALDEIKQAVPITFNVVMISAVIQIIVTIILGYLIYLFKDRKFRFILGFITIAGISIPGFYIASVYLNIFAVKYNVISVSANTGFMRYLHPAICLAIPCIMFYARLLAVYIEKEMNEDYVFYARCRGLTERRILFYHSIPRSIIVLIPSFMQNIGLTMAGAAIIERVFSLPGIGYLIIDSVLNRDSPMIHLAVLYLSFVLVITNILSDILQSFLQKDKLLKVVTKS